MSSKRFFAILLVLCMVLSNVAPAAAVMAPAESFAATVQNNEETAKVEATASPFTNDKVITTEDAEFDIQNLRDNPIEKADAATNESASNWVLSPTDKPEAELKKENALSIRNELEEAKEFFKADEKVCAFVILEDEPLAMSHESIAQVSPAVERVLIEKQDDLIAAIEKTVLGGQELEVRYQFTYLTNAFTIKATLAELAKIAEMDGVKTVFITPVYDPVTTADTNTYASGAMTGVHQVWEDLGYTGQGTRIAIIDTGLDLDHPSFAADPEGASMTVADIEAVLEDLNIYKRTGGTITAEELYRSAKVPFAYNYIDGNLVADHSDGLSGDHGTHVAGIAAANAVEGTTVVGMAPDAQLVIMKVFGANGGAYADDYVAAIEDAMLLECDAINLSLGSPSGFSTSDTEFDLIFERIASQNVVVTMSAGNDGTSSYGNLWGTDLNRTQNPDTSTVSSPSTYANGFSIASAGNSQIMSQYITTGDGDIVFYADSYEATLHDYGYSGFDDAISMLSLAGQELEYVYYDALDSIEQLYDAEGNSLVTGKVVVAYPGESIYYLQEMVDLVSATDAVALLIHYTREMDNFYNVLVSQETSDGEILIAVGMLEPKYGQILADAETKTLVISEAGEGAPRPVEGGQMSSFSSWGTTSDLRLVPDITGIGGDVYSCYDNGQYGVMSGTSMSAPQIAGVSALVMQYLKEKFPYATDGELHELSIALMMSTADPIIDSASGVEASPRQQGAGLVDAAEAVTAPAYLTVGGDRPKVELGDDRYQNGTFSFSFEIHNITDEELTYELSASLLTEAVVSGYGYYFMAEQDMELSGTVSFDKDTVTVPANGRASVKVQVTLSEEDLAFFAEAYPNGGFVEGYVYLCDQEGYPVLNLPYMGFYGDWTDAPLFDDGWWWENGFWGVDDGFGDADQYYHALWTDLGGQGFVLGMNPYGVTLNEDGNLDYDPAHNSISPNGDGLIDNIDDIYLSLLRGAKNLTFTWSADGEVMERYTCINVSKTMYRSAYGQIVPFIHSWYTDAYDFTDANGNPLPEGTVVNLHIDGRLDYGTGGDNVISVDMVVDTTAPKPAQVVELPQEDGSHYLGIIAEDIVGVAGAFLLNPAGTRILAEGYVEENGDGTSTILFDITGLGNEFQLALGDYACNEAYYELTYESSENLPEMDTDLLYGYRVNDSVLKSYLGYDYMFGWVSMDKTADDNGYVWVDQETDDHLEYYALTAAEYAGGYVFATDAANNFVVMKPGLWNRTTICNLGNVAGMDMAFDDTTDTMYLLGKESNYYVSLYAIDLASGALTQLKYYGYQGSAPWVLTVADDGTIYAMKYSASSYTASKLYVLDQANNYAMTPAVNAAGEDILITDANGANLKPNYTQSMTYSNGKIYWAYFYGSGWAGNTAYLVTIDTENDFAYTMNPWASIYPALDGYVEGSDTEVVGLLTLDETEYVVPAGDTLDSIWVDETRVIMNVGETAPIGINPIPWNYEITEATFASSDETVATVVDGSIVAVGKGDATITVTVDGKSAEIAVTVVKVEGGFYAYNYYGPDGTWGDMIYVDLADISTTSLGAAPADFMSGSYNGHDGCFYGYSEGGDFWRYNVETGEAALIGNSGGITPMDMAYDYSTGFMYAVTMDMNTGMGTISAVNLGNGKLVDLAQIYAPMTLACDAEGNLYVINYEGYLIKYTVEGGYVTGEEYLMTDLGYVNYLQSMCYSYEHDVLLWANAESGRVKWVDFKNAEPYVLELGNSAGFMEWVGMYEIPETIPERPQVAVESLTAENMMMVKGSTKQPEYSIAPLNATCQNVIWTSSDPSVVVVNADGTLTAVADGVAEITGELVDTVSGEVFTVTFTAEVITAADNIYGHVLGDLSTGGSQFWIGIDPADVANPVYVGDTTYTIYAEEYYDGKLYGYGFDPNDWSSNWQMFVMDPATYEVLEMKDLGEGFPFVYDMTYDYATSTMYAVAGSSSEDTNLYVVNMNDGSLLHYLTTEQMFMGLAAGNDGKLYAMEISASEYDWETWSTTVLPTNLYAIDPLTKEVELVGNTGINSNMIASMAYDFDTGYLYWAALSNESSGYKSGLYLVDPATATATYLGKIGTSGMQIGGMYILADSYPEEVEQLNGLILTPSNAMIGIGESVVLDAVTLPMNVDADVVWTSSDESVATVEDGVVTGLATGSTTITVTATLGETTKTATAKVVVMAKDAAFLSYNITEGGFWAINRHDYTVATKLTEDDGPKVNALVTVNGVVYGVDEENNFFSLDLTTFERTNIATIEVELDVDSGFDAYQIADLDYDPANDRVLALLHKYNSEWGELTYGRILCEIDLETGALTELLNFGETYYVVAIAVNTDGTIYYYTTFDDGVYILDMENRNDRLLISTQTQSLYGEGTLDQSMYYDDLTDTIYMMTTGNGSFYRMLTVDPTLGTLVNHSNVGEVIYDDLSWSYDGDAYAGMTFVDVSFDPSVSYTAEWKSITTSLGGDIGLNFYVELSNSVVNDPETYVQFTYGHQVVNVPMADAVAAPEKGEKVYRFTCPLTSKNMADDVTAQVFSAYGAVGTAKTTSVATYCNWVIENMSDEKTVNLMKAMLNYGAAAQMLFNYNTDNLANAALADADKVLADVDASAYAHTKEGAEDGISIKSMTLLLDTTITVRFYFELTGDKAIEEYTFLVNGEEAIPAEKDGKYYVEVVGIPAHKLDEMQTVTVGGLTVNYAALSYVNQVMNFYTSGTTYDMAKALYAFAMAAEAYIG